MTLYKTFVRMVYNRGTLQETSDNIPYSFVEHKYFVRAKWEYQQARKKGYDAYIKAFDSNKGIYIFYEGREIPYNL